MQCPFPGMDPYIERPTIWADFHDRLIAAISAQLQPLLRPKYAALVQDRLYVVESKRPIWPDVSIVESRSPRSEAASAAVVELDAPAIFELKQEEIRQPYLEIVEPAAGNRLITAIEVLSPDNKAPGPGRRKYLRKRREVRRNRANLVEIDLLRAGKPTFRIDASEVAKLPTWRYLAVVTRWPRRQEVYAIALQNRLPHFGVPLTKDDRDVPLDLQAAFTRVWREGPYPALLNYDAPPPGTMTPEEIAWCAGRVQVDS
jgi:Protein of unknown function (DUF4058)